MTIDDFADSIAPVKLLVKPKNKKPHMRTAKTCLFLAGVVFLFVSPLLAQDIRLKSGSLGFLKGEKTLNVEYVYVGMKVGNGTEQAYIDTKVAEYNNKEAGKGDKWLQSWTTNRVLHFEPKFEELLNKQFSARKVDLKAGKNPEAKYTLVLKTTHVEPGWNSVVARRDAKISTQAEFFETKDRSTELAVITILGAPGRDSMGYDFDASYRMQEGYAKTGKELGAFLYKHALK